MYNTGQNGEDSLQDTLSLVLCQEHAFQQEASLRDAQAKLASAVSAAAGACFSF